MKAFEAGPWEAKGTFTSDTAETMAGKLCVMSATGTVIAVTWSDDVRRMAAAAPDMLAALESIAARLDHIGIAADTRPAYDMALHAIAKAKGGDA